MTSVVSGIAINLFNQSPLKNCDKKRCILLLPVQSSSASVGQGGGGRVGCAGFRSGVMAEVSFRTKDKMYALLLLYRNFAAVIKSQGARDFPQLL